MLLGLNSVLFCRCFAEVKKSPDLPPELCEFAVLSGSKICRTSHIKYRNTILLGRASFPFC